MGQTCDHGTTRHNNEQTFHSKTGCLQGYDFFMTQLAAGFVASTHSYDEQLNKVNNKLNNNICGIVQLNLIVRTHEIRANPKV